MNKVVITAIFLIACGLVRAQTPTAEATQLQQYIQELRSSSEDMTVRRPIREKIIKLVASMQAAPTLPEDAEKHGFKAEYMVKSAKSAEDFKKAADEYYEATMLAPWVAEYYEDLGLALIGAGNLESAKDKFELYLIAAPNASDRTDVRKKIAELEVRMEQAAEDKKAAAAEEEKHAGIKRFRAGVEGKSYILSECNGNKHRGCTWSEFYDDGIRNGLPVWTNVGSGYHFVFVEDTAYLVDQASGDDIRQAKVRVVGDGSGLEWQVKNWQNGSWMGGRYANGGTSSNYSQADFTYSLDATNDAPFPSNAKKVNFYYLLTRKPL